MFHFQDKRVKKKKVCRFAKAQLKTARLTNRQAKASISAALMLWHFLAHWPLSPSLLIASMSCSVLSSSWSWQNCQADWLAIVFFFSLSPSSSFSSLLMQKKKRIHCSEVHLPGFLVHQNFHHCCHTLTYLTWLDFFVHLKRSFLEKGQKLWQC